jgi:hypothetical protein
MQFDVFLDLCEQVGESKAKQIEREEAENEVLSWNAILTSGWNPAVENY